MIEQWTAKTVLRYVNRTLECDILYSRREVFSLTSFTYSNRVGSIDDRKSTTDYVFTLCMCIVSWLSDKQQTVALLSSKVKYRATTIMVCEAFLVAKNTC